MGFSATVGKGAGNFAPTIELAIKMILLDLGRWSFDSHVEFYASSIDAEAQNWKIGVGLYKYPLNSDWPHWNKSSIGSIRQECKFWGAVKFTDGRPISILEHRPKSLFIALLIERFADLTTYWQQFDPLRVGQLTELAFLELTERSCLVQKHQFDCIEAAADDTRLIQWLELPAKAKSNTWYVFRNKAHFDAWLEQKNRFVEQHEKYPLETTGFDPFYSDSSENLRRQREIFLNRQKASLAGGVNIA